MKIKLQIALGILLLGLLSACGGGIRSRLDITSTPEQATVYFDGELRGQTPIEIPFIWYWHHDIELRKEGYETAQENKRLRCKPWLIFPLGGLAELMPFRIYDIRPMHYTLQPAPPAQD